DLGDGAGERASVIDPHVGGGPYAHRRQKLLLGKAVLANAKRFGPRTHQAGLGENFRSVEWNVLEFVSNKINGVRKLRQRQLILVGGYRPRAGDVKGRTFGIGRVNMGLEPKPRGRKRKHAPKLPAAQNANRCSGKKVYRQGLVLPRRLLCYSCG